MFKKRNVSIAAALALGGLLSLPAYAQEPQRVEITGSSIKRVAAEGALPVQVVTQEDIRRSGVTSVTDLIQALPVMQGFTSIADTVGGSGGGATTASLHDVGEQYTLVLLNGRRVAPTNSGTTIDLNSIPLAAIERVEILTDGASALYGADAIAGVINFILKKGEAPFAIEARVSKTDAGGGDEQNFNISKGFGNLERDGFSVFVAGSFDKRKQLKAADREFAKTGLLTGTYGDLSYDFFNGSSRSVPPNVDVFGPGIGGSRNSISFSPYKEANGNCPPAHVALGRQCFFDYTSTVEIAPEQERKAVYASGKLNLGKSGWTGFADLAYTDVSTIARIAPYPAEFGMSTDHPYFVKYISPYLTPAQRAVATDANVKYRLYDMGNRTYDYNTKSFHNVLGVQGTMGDWDMTLGFTYSKQDQDQNYLAGFPLADKFNAALDAGKFDPFPYAVGQMPAAQLKELLATQFVGNYNKTKIDMKAVDGNVQRELFKLPGGGAVLSMGFDARETGYKLSANPAVANAEILFDDIQPEFDLSRKTYGVYGEMLMPIAKSLEMTAAVRYDSIGGVDDSRNKVKSGGTEKATTFKLGGKWQASSNMLLRASYGTGFRAATMREIAQPKIDFGVTSGTYNCPFNANYDPLGYFKAGYICADDLQYEVYQGGNPNLKPEKSKQWNVGWVFQPTNELSVGLNYWAVEIRDSVSAVSEQLIMSEPAKYLSLFTTKFKASNNKTYVAILDAPVNIGKVQNEGIDWDLGWKGKTGFGRIDAKIMGTHLIKSRYTKPGTDNEWTTSLNQFGVNDAVSFRNVITAMGTVGHGNWEHTLTVKYRNGYKDQFWSEDDCVFYNTASGDCAGAALNVREHTTLDWRTQWKPMKNLTLVLAIENLMDKEPPLSLRVNGAGHQLGYDPRYASPYGRTFSFSGRYEF
ncbi:TonB-dependent receptor [Aquabacterium humicola]|uniref:TonB-dependent receptor n=1 Tax=Aquabacterium humicola TaxID=3237377 RepID=UPI002542DEBC|nr:TonB-dependent receptor [Rubrivivax pictus]